MKERLIISCLCTFFLSLSGCMKNAFVDTPDQRKQAVSLAQRFADACSKNQMTTIKQMAGYPFYLDKKWILLTPYAWEGFIEQMLEAKGTPSSVNLLQANFLTPEEVQKISPEFWQLMKKNGFERHAYVMLELQIDQKREQIAVILQMDEQQNWQVVGYTY